ncbi:hypothetical protein PVIIG_05573 [Plasmodium vivax India VII]|uniref:VIR protein n=1 Tax=Plasmodium vivax India VII TaxID=1077284 RepID=A0A0J9SJY8_PLAVI|nr:hypothetical protein PVIIG_05573 [Plasmodium vivax India VII]
MKYLLYLDDCTDQHYQKQGIIYLYLWLPYYEVRNKIYDGSTLENMKKMMNLFERLHSNDKNIHNIYYNEIENILNYELNDLFYLYDKFDSFQKEKECTGNRCNCAQECVDTFKNSVDKCNKYGNVYFCNELEKFRKQYNIYMPSVKTCPKVDSYLPSFKNYSTPVIILISFITILVLSTLLFILYKVISIFIYLFIFTPFGSCVRFRSKRPQMIYSNYTNEDANLLYTRERRTTPEAKPYNISYNSI